MNHNPISGNPMPTCLTDRKYGSGESPRRSANCKAIARVLISTESVGTVSGVLDACGDILEAGAQEGGIICYPWQSQI
jgi:hypothetical protein